MADVVLRTSGLTRAVAERAIVNDVSVDVYAGEVLAVMGPSGSGKSSFLRLLNRLDEPTGGTVYLDGQDYRQIPPRELRRRVGMVLQQAFLFPGTVEENLQFGPRQQGRTLPDAEVERLLDRVRLNGYRDRDVARLSGGEAQRVSLARTLANQPEVLLLDEPTSALDPAIKTDVEQLLAEVIRAEELTCVWVTHDQGQTVRMADRTMTIVAGRVANVQVRSRESAAAAAAPTTTE